MEGDVAYNVYLQCSATSQCPCTALEVARIINWCKFQPKLFWKALEKKGEGAKYLKVNALILSLVLFNFWWNPAIFLVSEKGSASLWCHYLVANGLVGSYYFHDYRQGGHWRGSWHFQGFDIDIDYIRLFYVCLFGLWSHLDIIFFHNFLYLKGQFVMIICVFR